MSLLDDATAAARLSWALPRLLHRPVTIESASAALRHRLEARETAWLAVIREAVYRQSRSPYRRLLGHAGCEPGDLARLVREDGLEGTLRRLYREGVYLTVEEFKGRRPVVRGSLRFTVDARALRNPRAAVHAFARSGGSGGAALPVPIDLGFVREQSTNACLMVHARGGDARWRKANWTVPGGGAIIMVLIASGFDRRIAAWFSQLDPNAASIPLRYRWSVRWVCGLSRALGRPIPTPRHVPLGQPGPVLAWMTATLARGEVPLLQTFTSSAVRLCEAALAAGVDIRGAQFVLGGEPITAARLAPLRAAGAESLAQYGSAETGSTMAYGCLRPTMPDECHLTHDLFALIQPEAVPPSAGLSRRALLTTTVRMRAPLILLNVSLGDEGTLARRDCGCPFEGRGWTTHLSGIRSFEKLTAGGMTFLDVDAIRVLEEVLPGRFGGGPADYQLVEDEDEAGHPRLALRIDPAVGPLDERAVGDLFLEALGRGEEARRVMALSWRDAGLLRIERRPPLTTSTGKILHLHRRPANGHAPGARGAADAGAAGGRAPVRPAAGPPGAWPARPAGRRVSSASCRRSRASRSRGSARRPGPSWRGSHRALP